MKPIDLLNKQILRIWTLCVNCHDICNCITMCDLVLVSEIITSFQHVNNVTKLNKPSQGEILWSSIFVSACDLAGWNQIGSNRNEVRVVLI